MRKSGTLYVLDPFEHVDGGRDGELNFDSVPWPVGSFGGKFATRPAEAGAWKNGNRGSIGGKKLSQTTLYHQHWTKQLCPSAKIIMSFRGANEHSQLNHSSLGKSIRKLP
jgi:hypothetical protein